MNNTMKIADDASIEELLADYAAHNQTTTAEAASPAPAGRDLPALMRKIPVTLTLEVGEAKLSLHELVRLQADSVVELNTLAGEPLLLKVNGQVIGRAEVVVSGENHGLKIVEIDGLDLDQLQP